MIDPMTSSMLTSFIAIKGEKPITVIHGDMHFIGEEFPDQFFIAHVVIVPYVVAEFNGSRQRQSLLSLLSLLGLSS